MRVSAQKQNQPPQQAPLNFATASAKPPAASHLVHPVTSLETAMSNRPGQLLQANRAELERNPRMSAATRFAHDFSWISVFSKAPVSPQAKLAINVPGDMYEMEADAIANRVMSMANTRSPLKPSSERLAPTLQTKSEGGSGLINALCDETADSQGGGHTMDANTQEFMQNRFGADFSHVRIHTDDKAAQMARKLAAQAFTVGRDIYFGSDKYSPGADRGKHLLAHELTHTIQQGYSSAMQKQTGACQQSEVGPHIVNEDERPVAGELLDTIPPQIQRSTSWGGARVHETRNKAADSLNGGRPETWQMLNGKMLKTEADADSSIKLPKVSTSGSGTEWKAKVVSVPEQNGAADETVLAPGPWSIVGTKAAVGAKFGLAACTGAGNSKFSANGKPSDKAVYKANRRHENHHATDDKVAFKETVGKWDEKVEEAKSEGTEYKGVNDAAARAALWAAMGDTPEKVARKYRSLCFTKGGQFHDTAAGGKMSISNPQANKDCSTSSVDVTNPS